MGLHLSQRREVIKGEPDVRTDYRVANDGLSVIVTRLVDAQVYSYTVNLDGTIGDLGTKVNGSALMTNDNFKALSKIVRDFNTENTNNT